MWAVAKVVTLFYVTAALSEAAVLPYKLPGVGSLFLGTVEGKSYFVDNSAARSWNAAKTACASIGMELASVETEAQKNFLDGINNLDFFGFYWTSGRDAINPQQFVWDQNAVSVAKVFDNFSYYVPPATCVLLRKRESLATYESHPCENTGSVNGPFGALCESV